MSDAWDPAQYERFREERSRPFHDLLALVQARPGLRVADLGCGTGELTRALHRRLRARETLGLDNSPAMLARARELAGDGLRFEAGDLASFAPEQPFDLVFSNAALQWVAEHDVLLERLSAALTPGGQLAVQVPANYDHPSHTVAAQVAGEAPFIEALASDGAHPGVLAPEAYAQRLHELGYAEQHVRLQVYGHRLDSREQVAEWVKGTLLTHYRSRLSPELYARFEARYREALVARLPDARPFFFPFKRILMWGRRPGP
jgi:trans-aconitate 2-methyltransferase